MWQPIPQGHKRGCSEYKIFDYDHHTITINSSRCGTEVIIFHSVPTGLSPPDSESSRLPWRLSYRMVSSRPKCNSNCLVPSHQLNLGTSGYNHSRNRLTPKSAPPDSQLPPFWRTAICARNRSCPRLIHPHRHCQHVGQGHTQPVGRLNTKQVR